MHELITLIKRQAGADISARETFAALRSIGQQEFYASHATDFNPELKFVLADYLEYEGENLVAYNGQRYRIVRTYRTGQELELVVERAPAEDGGVYG